jgi:hypothetical protein
MVGRLLLLSRHLPNMVWIATRLDKDDSQSWENTAAKAAVADMVNIVRGIVLSSIMDVCVAA